MSYDAATASMIMARRQTGADAVVYSHGFL